MLETKHKWLPVILAIFMPITFIITYSIAVANEHVKPFFPFISDTGTHPPESCVFGQLLDIGAVIALCIGYIRYRHVLIRYRDQPPQKCVLILNKVAFFFGIIICIGVSIVGNFQETNVYVVHLTGAFMAFGVGFIYLVLQTIVCHKTANACVKMPGNTVRVRRIRLVLCIIDLIFIIITVVAALIAKKKGPGEGKWEQLWSRDEPGYAEHVVSTVSEWVVAFITVGFLGTFYYEFKDFRVKAPQIDYNESAETTETSRVSTYQSMNT